VGAGPVRKTHGRRERHCYGSQQDAAARQCAWGQRVDFMELLLGDERVETDKKPPTGRLLIMDRATLDAAVDLSWRQPFLDCCCFWPGARTWDPHLSHQMRTIVGRRITTVSSVSTLYSVMRLLVMPWRRLREPATNRLHRIYMRGTHFDRSPDRCPEPAVNLQ